MSFDPVLHFLRGCLNAEPLGCLYYATFSPLILAAEIYLDASTLGKRPTELLWLFSPEINCGAWAPPLVRALTLTEPDGLP